MIATAAPELIAGTTQAVFAQVRSTVSWDSGPSVVKIRFAVLKRFPYTPTIGQHGANSRTSATAATRRQICRPFSGLGELLMKILD